MSFSLAPTTALALAEAATALAAEAVLAAKAAQAATAEAAQAANDLSAEAAEAAQAANDLSAEAVFAAEAAEAATEAAEAATVTATATFLASTYGEGSEEVIGVIPNYYVTDKFGFPMLGSMRESLHGLWAKKNFEHVLNGRLEYGKWHADQMVKKGAPFVAMESLLKWNVYACGEEVNKFIERHAFHLRNACGEVKMNVIWDFGGVRMTSLMYMINRGHVKGAFTLMSNTQNDIDCSVLTDELYNVAHLCVYDANARRHDEQFPLGNILSIMMDKGAKFNIKDNKGNSVYSLLHNMKQKGELKKFIGMEDWLEKHCSETPN